jgi:hypothetical protein
VRNNICNSAKYVYSEDKLTNKRKATKMENTQEVTRSEIKGAVLTYLIEQGWTTDDAYEAGCVVADYLEVGTK